jgi:hypothetical protein
LTEYQNEIGVAYWQWANSIYSINATNSLSWEQYQQNLNQDLFTGWYEISYFKTAYFFPSLNPDNQALFGLV